MGFMIAFIPFCILVIPVEIILGSRRDCIKGKWKGENGDSSDLKINPWGRLGLETLIYGVIIAVALWAIFWLLIPELLDPIISLIVSFLVPVAVTTLLLKRHLPKELNSFWNAYSQKKVEKETFRHYIFWNYLGPWICLLTYLLINLGIRAFYDNVFAEGAVDFLTLYVELTFTALILTIWMWSVSKTAFRVDLQIGRVQKEGREFSKTIVIILMLIVPIIITSVIFLVMLLLELYLITAIEAIIIDVVVGFVTGVFGLYLGILWGKIKGSFN
jgi:hypothetical protein